MLQLNSNFDVRYRKCHRYEHQVLHEKILTINTRTAPVSILHKCLYSDMPMYAFWYKYSRFVFSIKYGINFLIQTLHINARYALTFIYIYQITATAVPIAHYIYCIGES